LWDLRVARPSWSRLAPVHTAVPQQQRGAAKL